MLCLLNWGRVHPQGSLAINSVLLLASCAGLCDGCELWIALVGVAHQIELLLLFLRCDLDAALLNDSFSWTDTQVTFIWHLYDL